MANTVIFMWRVERRTKYWKQRGQAFNCFPKNYLAGYAQIICFLIIYFPIILNLETVVVVYNFVFIYSWMSTNEQFSPTCHIFCSVFLPYFADRLLCYSKFLGLCYCSQKHNITLDHKIIKCFCLAIHFQILLPILQKVK